MIVASAYHCAKLDLPRLKSMQHMQAMVLDAPGQPLRHVTRTVAEPGAEQLLIRVSACGVCRTDLHIVDGDLLQPKLPLIPGHEVVGRVVRSGDGAHEFSPGDRVGVPWLGTTCGQCFYCRSGQENLCDSPRFTGYTLDGGYAQYLVADRRFCFAMHMVHDAQHLGLYGFGAAAHIVAQVARYEGRRIYAFTRPGDLEGQSFARDLGAVWAGDSTSPAPRALDAAIIFAPVGALVPAALRSVRKGGTVVCAGIHMTDIPSFPYHLLWGERTIRSVANLTRKDGESFLALAAKVPIRTHIQTYSLKSANQALDDLRAGKVTGAAVLMVDETGAA